MKSERMRLARRRQLTPKHSGRQNHMDDYSEQGKAATATGARDDLSDELMEENGAADKTDPKSKRVSEKLCRRNWIIFRLGSPLRLLSLVGLPQAQRMGFIYGWGPARASFRDKGQVADSNRKLRHLV
jgi:hypothetical protein